MRLGDDLRSIAERYYGDPDRWLELYTANRAALGNEPILLPGQQLIIPVLPDPEAPAVARDQREPDGIVGPDGTIVPRGRTPDSPWLGTPPVLPPPRSAPPAPVRPAPLRSVFRLRRTRPDELEGIARLIEPHHRSSRSLFQPIREVKLLLLAGLAAVVLIFTVIRLIAGIFGGM